MEECGLNGGLHLGLMGFDDGEGDAKLAEPDFFERELEAAVGFGVQDGGINHGGGILGSDDAAGGEAGNMRNAGGEGDVAVGEVDDGGGVLGEVAGGLEGEGLGDGGVEGILVDGEGLIGDGGAFDGVVGVGDEVGIVDELLKAGVINGDGAVPVGL